MKVHLLALALGLFSSLSDCAIQSPSNLEARLLEHIFANYSPNVRPVLNHSEPVMIKLGLMLRQIIDVDMVNEVLTTSVWIRMFWKSELTMWDPSEFGGLESINVEPKMLWIPDLITYNRASKSSAGGSLYNTLDTKVSLEYTGKVTWLSPTILKTECMIDVRFFPFDFHNCRLSFGSWTHTTNKMVMKLSVNNVDTEAFSGDKEWVLENTKADVENKTFNCCPEQFSVVTFSLFIRRRAMFYLFNLIIPCGLITVLSLFSFILPPNSGERVSFVMTILLSLSVYMLIVTEKIPQSADIPISSKLFMCMMVEIALSLIATCFVIRFHNQDIPLPPWLKLLVNRWLAGALCMYNETSKNKNGSKVHDGIKDTSKYFKNEGFGKQDDILVTRVHEGNMTLANVIENDKKNDSSDNYRNNGSTKENFELLELGRKFSKLENKLHGIEEQEMLHSEWIFAAKVLDRFFLLTLCLSISLTFVWISIATPNGSVLD